MSAVFDVPAFELVRRPPPEPDIFVCVACERAIDRSSWASRDQIPPLCHSCVSTWSRSPGRLKGASRADQIEFARLKAIAARLDWEVMNGDGRWRRHHG